MQLTVSSASCIHNCALLQGATCFRQAALLPVRATRLARCMTTCASPPSHQSFDAEDDLDVDLADELSRFRSVETYQRMAERLDLVWKISKVRLDIWRLCLHLCLGYCKLRSVCPGIATPIIIWCHSLLPLCFRTVADVSRAAAVKAQGRRTVAGVMVQVTQRDESDILNMERMLNDGQG